MKKKKEYIPGDGSFVTSDHALLNLQRLLLVTGLPPLRELWNNVYPHDPITISDVAHFYSVMGETPFPNFRVPDERFAVIQDVRSIGYPELADLVAKRLSEKGVSS